MMIEKENRKDCLNPFYIGYVLDFITFFRHDTKEKSFFFVVDSSVLILQ